MNAHVILSGTDHFDRPNRKKTLGWGQDPELLENETVLRPREHMTDTHGYTEQLFGLCHLLGYAFMPRPVDLKTRSRRASAHLGRALGIVPQTEDELRRIGIHETDDARRVGNGRFRKLLEGTPGDLATAPRRLL